MTSSKLSVNLNKTEYLLFNPSKINPSVNTTNLDSNIITPSDSAKNLIVIIQTDKCPLINTSHPMLNHTSLNYVTSDVSVLLSKTAAITLMLYSRLDFFNSLFYGLPKYSIHRL